MQVRKYRVKKMSLGLEKIKRELGKDAVILGTAPLVGQRDGATLEITVATGPGAMPAQPSSAPVVRSQAASIHPKQNDVAPNQVMSAILDQVQALAQQVASLESEVRHLRLQKELRREDEESKRSEHWEREKLGLEMGLALLGRAPQGQFARAISLVHQSLLSSGLTEADAEALIGAAFARAGESESPELLIQAIADEVALRLSTISPLWKQRPARKQLAVVIGPTGVGKTTTVAKIAANSTFIGNRRVGIICADTFRIGGVYQLDRYAELIDVPLCVASSLGDLNEALKELSACDLILVDTTGRSPWENTDQGIRIEDFLCYSDEYEVQIHVCLSAATRTEDLVAITERYRHHNPNSLIFTKLDEARGAGGMISAAMASGLPLSHICDGQLVPDDIAAPNLNQISELLLHGLSAKKNRQRPRGHKARSRRMEVL